MDRGAIRTRGLALAALIAACLLAVLAAPAARAGTIWVTDGNMNAGQTGSCNAFGVYGDLPVFNVPSGCPMSLEGGGVVPEGQNAYWMTTAPPGVIINSAWTANGDVSASNLGPDGFVVGDFWRDVNSGAYGGSTLASGQQWFNTGLEGSSNINSQIYGIQLLCTQNVYAGGCPGAGGIHDLRDRARRHRELGALRDGTGRVVDDRILGVESAGRRVAGHAVRQRRLRHLLVAGDRREAALLNGPSEPRDDTVWQQCPNPVSWSFNVDTRSQVPTDGTFPIDLSATNAAGVAATSPQKTVSVDNDPVTVSFRTPNDANPGVWVNHAVTVDATAAAGPSRRRRNELHGGRRERDVLPHGWPGSEWRRRSHRQLHRVEQRCRPPGPAEHRHELDRRSTSTRRHRRSRSSRRAAGDPTALVVNASDSESGVAGGSIEMAPAGTEQLDEPADELRRPEPCRALRRRRSSRRLHLPGDLVRQRWQLRFDRASNWHSLCAPRPTRRSA